MSTFPTTTKIARILDSGRKHQAAELTAYLPVAYGHNRDWAGCTIVTIGLPDLISTSRCERSVGSFDRSILKYKYSVPSEGFLVQGVRRTQFTATGNRAVFSAGDDLANDSPLRRQYHQVLARLDRPPRRNGESRSARRCPRCIGRHPLGRRSCFLRLW